MTSLAWLVVSVHVAGVSPVERVADETTCRNIAAERNAGWVAQRPGEYPRWLCIRVVVPAEPCYRTTDADMRERHAIIPEPPPPAAIPEPGSIAALLAGIVGLACVRRG